MFLFFSYNIFCKPIGNIIMNNKIDSIYNLIEKKGIYYSNFDSLKYYLDIIKSHSIKNNLPLRLLEVEIFFAHSADYHYKIVEAEKYLKECFRIYETYNNKMKGSWDTDKQLLKNLLYTASQHYYNMGNITKSKEFVLKVISKIDLSKPDDSLMLFNSYIILAMDYYKLGQYDRSFNSYALAEKFLPHDNSYLLNYTVYKSHVGAFFCWIKEYSNAKPYYLNVIHTLERENSPTRMEFIFNSIV